MEQAARRVVSEMIFIKTCSILKSIFGNNVYNEMF